MSGGQTSGGRVALLLRAVNVGGRRLAMSDFKSALVALGHAEVQTVAATGNALIRAGAADAGLEAALEAGLTQALGMPTEVFARDAGQLETILAANPFAAMAQDDPSHLVVIFLKGEAQDAAVAALQAKIVGPEEVAAGPGCLFASYPAGIGESKLTAAVIERALGLRGTGRNWNVVGKLAALARG